MLHKHWIVISQGLYLKFRISVILVTILFFEGAQELPPRAANLQVKPQKTKQNKKPTEKLKRREKEKPKKKLREKLKKKLREKLKKKPKEKPKKKLR